MPGRDGTGPMGKGPMTGFGAGFCNGRATAGYVDYAGRFSSMGCQRGFRRAAINQEEEADLLNRESRLLENKLEQIKTRLSGLRKGSDE